MLLAALGAGPLGLGGQPAGIADAEALATPTPARLAAVQVAAQRDGWAPQAAMLRSAAVRAYEREKYGPAEAWLHVHQWAALLGEQETAFVPRWMAAVQAAKVGHSNMAPR